MDDLLTVCQMLAELAQAARTAQRCGDVVTLGQIARGRVDLVARCVTLWEQASLAERAVAAPLIEDALAADAQTIAGARGWLGQARHQLARLVIGVTTLRRYGAPLATLRDQARRRQVR